MENFSAKNGNEVVILKTCDHMNQPAWTELEKHALATVLTIIILSYLFVQAILPFVNACPLRVIIRKVIIFGKLNSSSA